MKVEHDIHLHTYLSVCGTDSATIEYYIASAKKLGLKKVGIADHMWDDKIPFVESMRHSRAAGDGEVVLNWYRKQNIAHCREILNDLAAADTQGVQFFFGGEVDYCPGLGAAITEEEAENLDFMVVPNSHTHHLMDKSIYAEPYEKHAEFMLRATLDICTAPTAKYVTSLAHPFDPTCPPHDPEYVVDALTDSQLKEAFCAAKEQNIASEINVSCFNTCPDDQLHNHYMMRILKAARDCGCKFTFGSDCHAAPNQDVLLRGPKIAAILGITEQDLHEFVR